MENVIGALEGLQASAVSMYSYAHMAHWNVEGILFVPMHGFFKDIYEDVYDSIDPISENIRKSGGHATYPPVHAPVVETSPRALLIHLEYLNNLCIDNSKNLFNVANAAGEQGIANFAADRMDKHQFWAWWIKSSLTSVTV